MQAILQRVTQDPETWQPAVVVDSDVREVQKLTQSMNWQYVWEVEWPKHRQQVKDITDEASWHSFLRAKFKDDPERHVYVNIDWPFPLTLKGFGVLVEHRLRTHCCRSRYEAALILRSEDFMRAVLEPENPEPLPPKHYLARKQILQLASV